MRRCGMILALSLVLSFSCSQVRLEAQTPHAAPTAREVMERVIAATGAAPPADTVDTLKAGDPATAVTGIATTFMDTYPVLVRAVAEGANLIITHEPSFYNHRDDRSSLAGDPVLGQKLAYIEAHHLVVWRFHDTWHLREPDGILAGVVDQFGWRQYQDPADPHRFTLPRASVAHIAASLRGKTGAVAIRMVGDPGLEVSRVALLPGASGREKQIKALEENGVELLVAGEAAEWETVPYVEDAAAEGRHKALILLGHEVSEEAGMEACAHWLRTLFPALPVHFIPAGEPFHVVEARGSDSQAAASRDAGDRAALGGVPGR